MPSNAQLAARLLRSAADFFRTVSEQSPTIKEQMEASARTYEDMADLVESDPTGECTLVAQRSEGETPE